MLYLELKSISLMEACVVYDLCAAFLYGIGRRIAGVIVQKQMQLCDIGGKIAGDHDIADLIVCLRVLLIREAVCLSQIVAENLCGERDQIRIGKACLDIAERFADQLV